MMSDDGSPSPTLNKDACRAVGHLLSTARAELGLPPGYVTERLMLSSAQLTGLERGDSTLFLTPLLFDRKLRRYAELLGVTSPLLDEVLQIAPPVLAPPAGHRVARPTTWLLVAAGLAVCLLGSSVALYYSSRLPAVGSSAVPDLPETISVPVPVATVQPPGRQAARTDTPTVLAAPVATSSSPLTPDRGRVVVAQMSWVFVRYPDNTVVERVLQPDQSLTLREWPIYLAVGSIGANNADGVEFSWGDRTVDVTPFANGNEVRIPVAQLAALAPDRVGPPASDLD